MNRNERAVIRMIEGSIDPTTTDIVEKSGLSKVTTLKYLNRLRGRGIIDYRMVGPSKLWYSIKHGKCLNLDELRPRLYNIINEFEALTGSKANIVADTNGIAIMATLTNDCEQQTAHRK